MSRYLCTLYEGPRTWGESRGFWRDPGAQPGAVIVDKEDAATAYVEQCWDGDGDPTDDVRVAVMDTETGQRWIVTVYGEAEIVWHARAAKEVSP